MNTFFLWTLILACAATEISSKINTDNLAEKLGIGLIFFGAALQLGHIHNSFMLIGCSIYFAAIAYTGLKAKQDRRKSDGTPKKRKLLS